MKRLYAIVLLLLSGAMCLAQNYPSEWTKYTSDGYFHDIESAASKQEALDLARTNMARQIQVQVSEVSRMDKQAVNGHTSILYNSQKNFSTDVDMALSETKSYYNEEQNKYYVLVYIDKAAACAYYENEVSMLVSNVGNAVTIANNYISNGFKKKAKVELEKTLQLFDDAGKTFFWLNVFGLNEARIRQYLSQVHSKEQEIRQMIADLEYGTTYFVVSSADLFGKEYTKLANEVKGELSASGCNFVDNPQAADIIISIEALARKYNEYQGAYFIYIDAVVKVFKSATAQTIFADEVSVKGGHTLGYDEAARDGYKKIVKEITKLLKENIKL